MKEYTLFEAIQRIMRCVNGEEIKVISIDKEAVNEYVPDIRCFGINIFHKHKTNSLYTINEVQLTNNSADSTIVDMREINSLKSYFKVKAIAASKFAPDGDNANHHIADEVFTAPWIDMPNELLQSWMNVEEDDEHYRLISLDYSGLTYLDYVNYNGVLSLLDVDSGICYIIGFDVNALKDKTVIDDINLSPVQKLGIPINSILSSQDDNVDNFVIIGNSNFYHAFPATDSSETNADLTLLPINQQENAYQDELSLVVIPNVDLTTVGITYKYVNSLDNNEEPAQLAP